MRLSLDRDKAEGLYQLLSHLLRNYYPENINERLVQDIVNRICEKLRKKVAGTFIKEYAIVLTPEEAKAYWIFFNQNTIDQRFIQEKNIIEEQCAMIDRAYG